jgi:hypothetical protein
MCVFSFFSVVAPDGECLLPPCTYFDVRSEATVATTYQPDDPDLACAAGAPFVLRHGRPLPNPRCHRKSRHTAVRGRGERAIERVSRMMMSHRA